jgi:3-dehydroquinate dehydratase-2
LLLLSVPIIEVHISDIKERESFRKTNLINDICEKSFIGHGVNGYKMGIDYLNEK